MKTSILITAVCLVTVLTGCSKSSVVFDEHGVVTAVTEAPTFRKRKGLMNETVTVLEDTCKKIKESTIVKVEAPQRQEPQEGEDSTVLKDIKELFNLVDNVSDLVPSHSVSVSVKCPTP